LTELAWVWTIDERWDARPEEREGMAGCLESRRVRLTYSNRFDKTSNCSGVILFRFGRGTPSWRDLAELRSLAGVTVGSLAR
jgi:hypothetical protein